MIQIARHLIAPLLLAAACSSSSGAGDTTTPPAGGGGEDAAPPTEQEQAEAKLRAAQESAVEALCERLYHCAVEDLPPEKRAEVKPEELEPKFRADCEDEANRSDLSPRQVRVIQRCVNEAQECGALAECLDEAQKK